MRVSAVVNPITTLSAISLALMSCTTVLALPHSNNGFNGGGRVRISRDDIIVRRAPGAPLASPPVSSSSSSLVRRAAVVATMHDYQEYAVNPDKYKYNGPFCGMPYKSLSNLDFITAWSGIDKATDCNTCWKITGPTGSTYVLMVDQKGDAGLDLSESAIAAVDAGWAAAGRTSVEMEKMADNSQCTAKWDGRCLPEVEGIANGGTNHDNKYCS